MPLSLGWENRHTNPVYSGEYHAWKSDVKKNRSFCHVRKEFVWQVTERGRPADAHRDAIRRTGGRRISVGFQQIGDVRPA